MLGKIFKWSAIVFGLAAGGLIIFFAFFFDLDDELNTQKDKFIPEIEQRLGRKIEVGSVATTLFPILGAELRDVVIKGVNAEDPPLLKLDKVSFEVEWWTALKSAGTDVRLKSLILDGLVVNLEVAADGRLSYADIIERLQQGPPAEASEPLDAETIRFIQGLQLERVALINGSVRLVDRTVVGEPAKTEINELEVSIEDVVLASPFEVVVRAAIFSDARNFEARAKLGPLPIGVEDAPLPLHWVSVDAKGVDLAGIVPYLGADLGAQIESAQLTANVRIDDPLGAKGSIRSKGSIEVANVQLGSPPGEPFTLSLTPNFDFQQAKGEIDLTGFRVAIDDMVLTAAGRAYILARRPRFEGVEIKTENFDFDRLLKRVPLIAQALPPGAKLGGPFQIAVSANGDADTQTFIANLGFDGARVLIPGALSKPAGTPLSLSLDATLSPDKLDIRKSTLRAGSLDLNLAGTVANFKAPVLNIKGGTDRFAIDGLMRLLPNVRSAVPADVKIAGQAEIDIRFAGTASSMDGQVKVGIFDADLAVPGTTLKGTGSIDATFKGAPTAVGVNAELTGMSISAGDGFRKPAGTAMALSAQGTLGGSTLNLASFALKLGPLDVRGSGSINTATTAMDIQADIPEFAFKDLAAIIPSLGEGLLGTARVGTKVQFSGSPSNLASVDAKLDNFRFSAGKNSIAGDLSVANLDAPRVRFKLTSPQLDLDDMFPPGKEEAASESGGPLPPIVKRIDADGALSIAKGRAGGIDFKKFESRVTMKNGVVRFDRLEFLAYDGTFTASKTSVDLSRAEPAFDLDMQVKRVDVAAILTDQANMPRTLSGRATTDLRLRGQGSEWRTISKTLAGDLAMNLKDGKFESLQLESSLFEKVQKKVPFIKLPKQTKGTALKGLFGQFTVDNGRMKLQKPLTMETPQGPMSMEGSIGLDSSLDLTGNISVPASLIRKLSGGKIKLAKAVPVALKIGGTLTKPKISGVDAAALVTALVGGSALALAQDKLDEAKAKAEALKKQAEQEARKLANKAKAEAEKKANEIKDKAKAEAKKVEDKAKKAAGNAADKAKDEAAKRLKGLF